MVKKEKVEKLEKEYVIPLRARYQHVARYKKTPKAVKTVKEFLVRHMKIYDRDLKKIKIDKYLNEYLWFNGIKNPPHKVKVKAIKEGEFVRVELIDYPNNLKFKKLREEKAEKTAKEIVDKNKTLMQKMKESKGASGEKSTDENKDGVDDKVGEKEKIKSVEEAGQKLQEQSAKQMKHTTKTKAKEPKRPVRQALQK